MALRPFFITTLAPVNTRLADRRSHELNRAGLGKGPPRPSLIA